MSTQALVTFAAAFEKWLAQQNYDKRTQERVSALTSLGLDIDPEDLKELKQ